MKLNNIDNKEVCSSCAAYIILFSVFLSITIGIATVLIYFYWLKRMKSSKQINIKNQTYYFFNDMIKIADFDHKIDKKSHAKISVFITLNTSQ